MDSKAPAGGRAQHPLPKAQRPQVSVDDLTLERWKQNALDDTKAVLQDRNSWFYSFDEFLGRHEYKVLLDKPNMRGAGRVCQGEDSLTVEFLCRLQLELTLQDVVLALHNVTNLEQRLAFVQIYQDIVLDAALIELYQEETEQDPFHCVSIKWIAFDSPARQLLRCRDSLYFEFCFTTQDAFGRQVLVEYKKSTDLQPDQLRDHGLDILRSPTFTLTTYHTEGSSVVSQVRGVNEPNGSLKSWVSMNYLPIVFARYLNLDQLPHSKAMLRAGVRPSALATRQSTHAAIHCHSCRRKFGITTRKSWCRACGRTVCRRCTCKLILPMEGDQIASSLPTVRTRFCRGCIVFAHCQTKAGAKPNVMRPARNSDFSCVDNDSFFGTSDLTSPRRSTLDHVAVRPAPSYKPLLCASRLERMLARLSFSSDRHQEAENQPVDSLTDESSESSRTSNLPVYADDGMRVFFPSAKARASN